MATAKIVNYTDEQAAALKAAYVAAGDEQSREAVKTEFAEKFGKSVKSIVAKLVKMEVYHAKEYKTKAGETPVKKDETADAIGKILGLTENDTSSLAKANKVAIAKVFSALANSVPVEAETPEETAAKPDSIAVLVRVAGLTAEDAKSIGRVRGAVLAKIAAAFAD